MNPRLIVHIATDDLGVFQQTAESAVVLSDRFDVRVVVSSLTRKNPAELANRRDLYLEYTANFPKLFHFCVPDVLQPYFDMAYVEANRTLMARKVVLLREMGFGGAFLGIEPSFVPEAVFDEHPAWRGSQMDHPVRSMDPTFALDMNHPDVEALYRKTVEGLVGQFSELDSFFMWTNDAAAGFSWFEGLYFGPNGPEGTRHKGYAGATAAWHRAVLEGARAGGAEAPVSVIHCGDTRVDYRDMPQGAYRFTKNDADVGRDKVLCLGADVSMTYPVRYLWDPMRVFEKVKQVHDLKPDVVTVYVSDVYHRTHTDLPATRRLFRLWDTADRNPEAIRRLPGQISLLGNLAESEFGPEGADEVVDGWIERHEAFKLQYANLGLVITQYLPLYGAVSHRWLTRPLVVFPDELSEEDEAYFLPHVWKWCGDQERRNQFLDIHGYSVANPSGAYNQHSDLLRRIASGFDATAGHFEKAAREAKEDVQEELRLMARAAGLMACIWRTCLHTIEFGVLLRRGIERTEEEMAALMTRDVYTQVLFEGGGHTSYQRRLYGALRREIDNILSFQEILGEDPERVVWRANVPEGEDTVTLGPDLQAQLTQKRRLILANWHKVARLRPSVPSETQGR